MSNRTKTINIRLTEKEYEELSKIAKNSYAGYLATFVYRVLQEILSGKIKI